MTSRMDKSSVQEIIERSGNSFHSRVVNKLRDEGWSVLVSPHYNDNFTDKPREIDIIAEKRFEVRNHFNDYSGAISVRLFIECKYITGETVFWFESKDMARATERVMHDTGMGDPKGYSFTQKHHYLLNYPVAKLVASDKKRTEENDAVNKAINQVLNALVYYRHRGDLHIIPTEREYRDDVLQLVSYPFIVVNSFENFYATNMSGEGDANPITAAFQWEANNYAYTDKKREGQNEYFLIDVLSLDLLPSFLTSAIKIDAEALSESVRWNEYENRRSLQRHNHDFDRHSSM